MGEFESFVVRSGLVLGSGGCLLADLLANADSELDAALLTVNRAEDVSSFSGRLRRAHTASAESHEATDWRVLDQVAQIEAYAWLSNVSGLGSAEIREPDSEAIWVPSDRPDFLMRRMGERERARLTAPSAKSTIAFAAWATDHEIRLQRAASSAIKLAELHFAERLVFFVHVDHRTSLTTSTSRVSELAEQWLGRWKSGVTSARAQLRTPDDFLQQEAWLEWAGNAWRDWRFEAWVVVCADHRWRTATILRW